MARPLQKVGDMLSGFRADIGGYGVSHRAKRDARRAESLRALDTSRVKAMAEDARVVSGLLRAGATDVADSFMSDRIANIKRLDGDTFHSEEIQRHIREGKIDELLPELDAFVAGAQSGKVLDRAGVQSSQILPDGTVHMVMSDGSTRTVAPDGNEVGGGDASGAIRSAQEYGVDLQRRRAEGRSAGSATGKGNTERLQTTVNEGVHSAKGMAILRRSIALLDEVKTGGIDAALMRAKSMFGIEAANEAELSANLGRTVLSQLRSVFGAQFTEREGARLEKIEASFGKSIEGNKRLLRQTLRMAEREAKRALDAAIELKDFHAAADIQALMDDQFSEEDLMNVFSTPQPSGIGRFKVEVVE